MENETYNLEEIMQNAPIICNNVYHLKNALDMCSGSNVSIVCSIDEKTGKIKGYDKNESICIEIDKDMRTVFISPEYRYVYENLSEQAKRNLKDSVKVLKICHIPKLGYIPKGNPKIVRKNCQWLASLFPKDENGRIDIEFGVDQEKGKFTDIKQGILFKIGMYRPTGMLAISKKRYENLKSKLSEDAKINLDATMDVYRRDYF